MAAKVDIVEITEPVGVMRRMRQGRLAGLLRQIDPAQPLRRLPQRVHFLGAVRSFHAQQVLAHLGVGHCLLREHNHGAFQNIAKLADIPRPGITRQFRHRAVIHIRYRPVPSLGQLGQNGGGDQRDVHLPFGEAWYLDREDIDPVIEVSAEGTVIDARLNVLVGGADKAEINIDLVIAANPLNGAVFQYAQQLGLQRQRHIADLIKEQGSAVCEFDPAFARLVGAGEGAFLMTEDFGFQQFGRDRCAIY